jgi:predicted RNA binding protein YcfA (HicA-like mRNA interferase family)
MGDLPVLRPRAVIQVLEKLGFTEVRQRGSHKQFRHPDGRCTTVPVHGSRDVDPIMLRLIAKDVGLMAWEFIKHVS